MKLHNFLHRTWTVPRYAAFEVHVRAALGIFNSIKLLHDNAPAHISATVQEYLTESGLNVLGHPPYSPDMSPWDFDCSQN